MKVTGQYGICLDDKQANQSYEGRIERCAFQDIVDFDMTHYTCRDDDAFEHLILLDKKGKIQQVFSSQQDDYIIVYSDQKALGSHDKRFYLRVINPDGCDTITLWAIEGKCQRIEEEHLAEFNFTEEDLTQQVEQWVKKHNLSDKAIHFNYLIFIVVEKQAIN